MKRLGSSLSLLAANLALAGAAWCAPVISLVPQVGTVLPLHNFYVDVVVSGLQSGGTNSLLGAFDLTLNYDTQIVQFLQIGSWLGTGLGDPDDPAQTFKGADENVPGSFHFYEVSLLESSAANCFFCAGPYLEDLQSDSFLLAHMLFYSSGPTGPATGAAAFTLSSPLLADADGNAIAGVSTVGAAVNVIPEPSTLLLVLSAFVMAMVAVNASRRQWLPRRDPARRAKVLPPSKATRWSLMAAIPVSFLGMASAHAAIFTIPSGDAAALVQAIGIANGLAGPSVINLGMGTYVFASPSESTQLFGSNALPTISGDLVINGNGATLMRQPGAATMRAIQISGIGRLTLNKVTLTAFNQRAGNGQDSSGAVLNQGQLSLIDCGVNDNVGPGLTNYSTASMLNSTFLRNQPGGAILNQSGGTMVVKGGRISANVSNEGAGILNMGILSIENALIDGNSSRDGAGLANAGTATLTNTTVSGNTASGDGGGVWNLVSIHFVNTTVAGNSAGRFGGGIWNSQPVFPNPAALRLDNTLVAGNIGSVAVGLNSMDDCTDNDHNTNGSSSLIQDGGCRAATHGFLVGSPSIGVLDNNGGATWTHALLPGSIAIDAGDPAMCPTTDQRGVPRPQDGDANGLARCDIGAFEYARSAADFIVDGCVDRNDLARLLAEIGSVGVKDPMFDLNGDGKINIADARKLVTMFSKPGGQACR